MGEAGLAGWTDILNPDATEGDWAGDTDIYYKARTLFFAADMPPVKLPTVYLNYKEM